MTLQSVVFMKNQNLLCCERDERFIRLLQRLFSFLQTQLSRLAENELTIF